MESIHYVGLDVHKKTIAYCVKTVSGKTVQQGVVGAERTALQQWLTELPGPWMGALEATLDSIHTSPQFCHRIWSNRKHRYS